MSCPENVGCARKVRLRRARAPASVVTSAAAQRKCVLVSEETQNAWGVEGC